MVVVSVCVGECFRCCSVVSCCSVSFIKLKCFPAVFLCVLVSVFASVSVVLNPTNPPLFVSDDNDDNEDGVGVGVGVGEVVDADDEVEEDVDVGVSMDDDADEVERITEK